MVVKVLIVRFSSIGDIVLTTPVIRCVKEQLVGDVEVHYLTKTGYAPILHANPYLSKVHTIENKVSEVIEELRAEEFDYIVDLHNNLRSAQVKKGLKRMTFIVNKINWQKWLMVNFKINRLPEKHIVDRYMETVSAFEIENDHKGLDYFIAEEDEVELSVLPTTHRFGYVAFAIAGTYTTKCLPVEKIISICRKIEKPIVLLGGKEDAARGAKVTLAGFRKDIIIELFNEAG